MCILVLHEEVKSIMRLSTQASDMVRTQNTSINMQAETKALKKKRNSLAAKRPGPPLALCTALTLAESYIRGSVL